MKTKREILEADGWECLVGYIFDYEKPDFDECKSILIEKEEIEAFLKQEPKPYYFKEYYETCVDEADAWESFCEDYCDEHNVDLTDDEVYDLLKGVRD